MGGGSASGRDARAALEVVRAGALTTIQDLGRPGHAHLGVPHSGAADMGAHLRANAAVGNSRGAATLEATLLGCVLRARAAAVLAVSGANCDVYVGGVRAPWAAPFRVRAGQVVEVGAARTGLRSYIAVRGGIDVPPVLGSRSTDTLSGMGPAPVRDGDLLPVGDAVRAEPSWVQEAGARSGVVPADGAPSDGAHSDRAHSDRAHSDRAHSDRAHSDGADSRFVAERVGPTGERVVELVRGPRHAWLAREGWEALTRGAWQVGTHSNRVGVRLEGEPLARARRDEIPSEGIVTGAVQLPPSGVPVIFLADHPTTGGYPVIAVASEHGIATVAQARPGDTLRFTVRRI